MNVDEKRIFVVDLCNAVRDTVLKEAASMPEEWDGIELRWYLERAFVAQAMHNATHVIQGGKRQRDFRNHCAVSALQY